MQEERGYFPHVYANGEGGVLKLGVEEVESVGKWERGGEWSASEWPWEEDRPVA